MTKWIVGAVVIACVIGGLFWYMYKHQGGASAPAAQTPPATQAPAMQSYASTTMGIIVEYPQGYTLNDSYIYQFSAKKVIHGVKFTIPASMATGTNLAFDSGASVEQLPRAKICTGDIFLVANVKATTMTFGSTTFSVASSTTGAAGSSFEEQVYAIPGSKPCIAVRYFIHSGTIANYPAGTVQAFDRAALLSDFDSIRDSLILTSTQP